MSLYRNTEADVRYSNLPDTPRPGWLADDQEWRRQLKALSQDDVRWFEAHWHLAGGQPPRLDLSWLTFDKIR